MSEFEEGAKAVQEVAKLGAEVTKAGRDFGGFVARVFGAPVEQASGLLEDRLRFHRAMQRMDFMDRFERQRERLGLTGPLNAVPLKFGVPLLEAAALEDDPDLRDMMATLLAKATSETGQEDRRTAFVAMLSGMEPLDAKVLLAAYNARTPPRSNGYRIVNTAGVPEAETVLDERATRTPEPRPEVRRALWNLVRLGCIQPGGGWGGVSSIGVVTITDLGIALIEATTLPEQRTYQPPSDNPA